MKQGNGGWKTVSNYQRLLIKAVVDNGTRSKAAEALGINARSLDDALYRAYKALRVDNITDAYYLVSNGILSRPPEEEKQEKAVSV
jgi:hypothetical protein